MSKIDEMLKNEKIEWKKLGEVCEFKRGNPITKKSIVDGNIPVIAGGQTPAYYHASSNREGKTIAVAGSGAYAGFVSFWEKPIFLSDAFSIEPNEKLEKKYLYYWLLSIQHKIYDLKQGVGIPHVYGKDLAKFEIPIPSLETQKKIVETLDKFTNYVTELKAELKARNSQYEYYRDLLLSEEYLLKISESIDKLGGETNKEDKIYITKLKDISLYSKEKISSSEIDRNNYVGVDNLVKDKGGKINSNYLPDNKSFTRYDVGDILIGNIRPNLRKIWLSDQIGGTNTDVLVIKIKDNKVILPKYLYQVLSDEKFFYYNIIHSKGAKMPRGDKDKIMDFEFYLPPIHIQNRVVNILDKFQSLLSNTQGLIPEEIEKRQKQYEYYREKLLTFELECDKTDRQTDRQTDNNF